MTASAFVPCSPLCLVSTNEALSLKHREGYRQAIRVQKGKHPLSGCHPYQDAQAFLRLLVRAHTRKLVTAVARWQSVDLDVVVTPHRPWDDDAGSIVVKWVVDELAALLRWSKDRRRIRWLRFRTNMDEADPSGIYLAIHEVPDA